MHLTDTLIKIRVLFIVSIFSLIAILFMLSVTFRDRELTFIQSTEQILSTLGYRIQYGFALLRDTSIPAEKGTARSIPVLLYHGIVSKPDRFSLTEARFKEQMFALKQAGYTTITMSDFIAFERGEKQLPDKSFLLTFDDGRTDSFEGADPILSAVGFNAVMFVATDASLDASEQHNSYYLDENGLQRMLATGRWEIGSHAMQMGGGFVPIDMLGTQGNFLSDRKWLTGKNRLENSAEYEARITRELASSKEELSKRLGITVNSFSYPFGDYGQQSDNNESAAERIIRRLVAEQYDVAFKQVWPLDNEYSFNYPDDDPLQLRRIESGTDWSGNYLVEFLQKARDKDIPLHDDLSGDIGWKYNWGSVNVSSGALRLSAADGSTGALAFLDGTRDWGDYYFSAATISRHGYTSLIARYVDGDNMVSCTFGPASVQIDQKLQGKTSAVGISRAVSTDGTLGIEVHGNRVRCTVNDTVVATSFFNNSLDRGGIAIRTWDQSPGAALVSVDSISVSADDSALRVAPASVRRNEVPVRATTTVNSSAPSAAAEPVLSNVAYSIVRVGTTSSESPATSSNPDPSITRVSSSTFESLIKKFRDRADTRKRLRH